MDVTVNGNRSVTYKRKTYLPGQTIPNMERNEAARLIGKGHVLPLDDDDGVIARTKPPEKMTVPELKELLDKLQVDYPASANKSDLIELLNKHTAEPPAE